MHATVTVNLGPGDTVGVDPEEIANAVLAALNGDPEKDVVAVSISAAATVGSYPPPPVTEVEPPA